MRAGTGRLVVGVMLAAAAFSSWAGATNASPGILPGKSMLTMGGIVSTPERKPSPLFSGKTLGRPPPQTAPWSPPASTLPTNYISATALLFEQGLADPRGCDYREIEVGTGNVWTGDGGVVKTHGWVLPGEGKPAFAICWNGLVYPLASVGAYADLQTDVAIMVTNGVRSWYSALPEDLSVAVRTLAGTRGCLLLRLGRADLARDCWLALGRANADRMSQMSRSSRTNQSGTNTQLTLPEADPYLTWAGDWAWALFDRMICAHMRGDENLALADARLLSAVRPQVEAACARRGFERPPTFSGFDQEGQPQPYLNFLDQLPQLLADLERREKEGPRIPATAGSGLTNATSPAERVAALVRDLDLARARQWGQPGGVNLAEDPTVATLIGEGGVAVEPLLDCLEHDPRLTRSVSFGRNFHRGRTVLSVHQAAWVALRTILEADFSNAAEMRAYWNKYKGLKLEERWYAILNDDAARNRWLEAAANIVAPENVTQYPGGFRVERPVPTNAPAALRGESLRQKQHPSVSELLTRHALEAPTNNPGSYDLSGCCQMAECLARWDVQAALPVAETLSKRASAVLKYSGQPLGSYVTKLALARARAGDAQAFDDYAQWIVTTSPEQFARSSLECFEPFKQFPTNSLLRTVAEQLFCRTNSPWASLPWKSDSGGAVTVDSELVTVPAYRVLLCHELGKTNLCATVALESPGYLSYRNTTLNQSGRFAVTLPNTSSATNGSTASIRWCDWVGLALANGKHIAPFDPFAPPAQRDQAIRQAISRLQEPD